MKHLLITLFLLGLGHTEPIKINLVTTNDIHGMISPQTANFMNPQYPPTILGGAAFSKYVDELRDKVNNNDEGTEMWKTHFNYKRSFTFISKIGLIFNLSFSFSNSLLTLPIILFFLITSKLTLLSEGMGKDNAGKFINKTNNIIIFFIIYLY